MKTQTQNVEPARRNTGYTLAEIMIVVMVIGILTSVAFPSYKKVRETARREQAIQELAILHSGIDRLGWDTGMWPSMTKRNTYLSGGHPGEYSGSLRLGACGLTSNNAAYGTSWKGPYLSAGAIPRDPWGSEYWFDPHHYRTGHCYAAVVSRGPDKISYNNDDLYMILQIYY